MDPEDDSVQMHLLPEYNPSSPNAQILYKLLFDNLRAKDIRSFKILIEQGMKKQPSAININYVNQTGSDDTYLDLACRNGLTEFVKFLLEKGANPNRINEAHNRAPLHFATEAGYVDVLKILLNEPTTNPNCEAGQQTALHIAVRNNDLDCAECLLEGGASPNIPNSKGITALHLAAMKQQQSMVKLIMERSSYPPNLDKYKDYNDRTTRDVLQNKFPQFPLPPASVKTAIDIHELRYYLNKNDEMNFLKNLDDVQVDELNLVADDLLEMAADRDFRQAVVVLLDRLRNSGCNVMKAARAAVQKGHPAILRELLNTDPNLGNELIISACSELAMPGKHGSDNTVDRLECLKLILENPDVDVRCADSKGNTPLHYAARSGCHGAVTLLLQRGSYIGHMNTFNVPPLADISASTLSQYFDDCLKTRKERVDEHIIEFNYQCLMPHDNFLSNSNNRMKVSTTYYEKSCEMESLKYIASNNALKHLLKHPLLSSFLYLKWHRIRHVLYANFIFYVIVYLLLNIYILRMTFSNSLAVVQFNSNDTNDTGTDSIIVNTAVVHEGLLWIITAIAVACLALRELLQLISSPWHYLSNFENWLEMTLIVLGVSLLVGAGPQVGAVAILLSAWELVIFIGQHPRMSTGIEMFKTVSINFLRFLFLYAFLILAFVLAFFILFKDGGDNNFSDPGHTLFKTIIMLTGEFDANDIPFASHPILSHCVFMVFVFLIAIVLFNLLNGLAVSDTADILGKAELIGLISRIKLVAYVENVAVSPRFSHKTCSCCYNLIRKCWLNALTFLARRILLFPNYLKEGKLVVKSYENLGAYSTNKCYGKCFDTDIEKHKDCKVLKMEPRIIKQAKDIISRKDRLSDNERIIVEIRRLNDRLFTIETTLDSIKCALENNNLNVSAGNDVC